MRTWHRWIPIAASWLLTVPQRADSVTLYRDLIGDEWSDYLAQIYDLGKGRWAYLVPADLAERATLRDLCDRTLAFENPFLRAYREQLLAECRDGNEEQRAAAATRLRELGFDDEDARY